MCILLSKYSKKYAFKNIRLSNLKKNLWKKRKTTLPAACKLKFKKKLWTQFTFHENVIILNDMNLIIKKQNV